jgi:hypothetical protein
MRCPVVTVETKLFEASPACDGARRRYAETGVHFETLGARTQGENSRRRGSTTRRLQEGASIPACRFTRTQLAVVVSETWQRFAYQPASTET